MTERQHHPSRDLQALRYLDALDRGDLETVAALWDEAKDDSELEAMLAEIDSALVVEATHENCDFSKDRQPPFLPGRLTRPTSILSRSTSRRWHWAVAAVGLAVACWTGTFLWPSRSDERPIAGTESPEQGQLVKAPTQKDPIRIATARKSWRTLDGEEDQPFVWPLPESVVTASTSIPADLLR